MLIWIDTQFSFSDNLIYNFEQFTIIKSGVKDQNMNIARL